MYRFDNKEYNSTYKAFTMENFRSLPQVQEMTEEQKFSMEVVGHVLPFKTNSYVVNELIDWEKAPNDPIFALTFSDKKMLSPRHYEQMASVLSNGRNPNKISEISNKIRVELNPHPAGQLEKNIPTLEGEKLEGMQHKYKETILFFPSQGQGCYAYCSFCFRWTQFVGGNNQKFLTSKADRLIDYVRNHPEISDILITGGDPLIMKAGNLATYIRDILKADLPNLSTIRIGTKTLGYWPYRFLTDSDTNDLLALFREVVRSGKHLAIMAHFNHPNEMKTNAVKKAIGRIIETGAQIRTQTPLLTHINDSSEILSELWKEQVKLGCIPYYMFIVRDTGAQHYFGIPLARAFSLYQEAYQKLSGLSRSVRGPIMACNPGKLQILGITDVQGEKVFVLQFLQARNPEWVNHPFFAKYDEKAIWFDELKPAFGKEKFFFEEN